MCFEETVHQLGDSTCDPQVNVLAIGTVLLSATGAVDATTVATSRTIVVSVCTAQLSGEENTHTSTFKREM